MEPQSAPDLTLPRVAIRFCTQCKWNLRAAYFAQELLSTFGSTIGEVALIPATGGVFTITLTYKPSETSEEEMTIEGDEDVKAMHIVLWDWKTDKTFPGTSGALLHFHPLTSLFSRKRFASSLCLFVIYPHAGN
jgi:selT/selW/selH-like putative selenoprotein